MTWEIVVGIIALIGCMISIMTPIVKVTKVIATLTATIDTLAKITAELEKTVRKNTEDIIIIKSVLKEDK